MFSKITTKRHCRKVLSGRLSGNRLLTKLGSNINGPEKNSTLPWASTANHSLMWHMAHCPQAKDRQAVLELATSLEPSFRFLEQGFESTLEALVKPIPFSPISIGIKYPEDVCYEALFPAVKIDWQETYRIVSSSPLYLFGFLGAFANAGLISGNPFAYSSKTGFLRLGQELGNDMEAVKDIFRKHLSAGLPQLGAPLTMTANIPSYTDLMLQERALEDGSKLYHHLHQAMVIRNRKVSLPSLPDRTLLAFSPSEFTACQESESERMVAFKIPMGKEESLLTLFIKNNWPLGYAIAMPDDSSGTRDASIGFYIFPEFRGTQSSSTFFGSFMNIIKETYQPKSILIGRASSDATLLEQEDHKAITRFFKRFGFRWVPGRNDLMYKHVG